VAAKGYLLCQNEGGPVRNAEVWEKELEKKGLYHGFDAWVYYSG